MRYYIYVIFISILICSGCANTARNICESDAHGQEFRCLNTRIEKRNGVRYLSCLIVNTGEEAVFVNDCAVLIASVTTSRTDGIESRHDGMIPSHPPQAVDRYCRLTPVPSNVSSYTAVNSMTFEFALDQLGASGSPIQLNNAKMGVAVVGSDQRSNTVFIPINVKSNIKYPP